MDVAGKKFEAATGLKASPAEAGREFSSRGGPASGEKRRARGTFHPQGAEDDIFGWHVSPRRDRPLVEEPSVLNQKELR